MFQDQGFFEVSSQQTEKIRAADLYCMDPNSANSSACWAGVVSGTRSTWPNITIVVDLSWQIVSSWPTDDQHNRYQ